MCICSPKRENSFLYVYLLSQEGKFFPLSVSALPRGQILSNKCICSPTRANSFHYVYMLSQEGKFFPLCVNALPRGQILSIKCICSFMRANSFHYVYMLSKEGKLCEKKNISISERPVQPVSFVKSPACF